MSDWRLRLFPPGQREWGDAYLADFDRGVGLMRVVVYAWYLTIRRNPVKTVVVATSVALVAIGTHLALLQQGPPVVTLFTFALMAQGIYTLVYMTGRLSLLEPIATSVLLAGETAALLASLSGFGSTMFEYVRRIDQALVGPIPIRVLVAVQALFTVYHYAFGQRTVLPRTKVHASGRHMFGRRQAGRRSRRLSESLVATGIMLLGLLLVDLIATPRLREMAWMILLFAVVPYTIASFVMVSRSKKSDLSANVIRSLAYVAVPTLAVFFVFWRDLGELRQAVIPGFLVLTSGAITGAGLLSLHDKSSEQKRRAESSVGS